LFFTAPRHFPRARPPSSKVAHRLFFFKAQSISSPHSLDSFHTSTARSGLLLHCLLAATFRIFTLSLSPVLFFNAVSTPETSGKNHFTPPLQKGDRLGRTRACFFLPHPPTNHLTDILLILCIVTSEDGQFWTPNRSHGLYRGGLRTLIITDFFALANGSAPGYP